MPLGAFGALLDPSTLQPVKGSLAEICEQIQRDYENKEHVVDVFFRPATSSTKATKHLTGAALPAPGGDRDGVQMPCNSHDMDAMVWEHGLSEAFPRQKAILCAIRHAFYKLGIRSEEAVNQAIQDWFRRKHNNLSGRYLSDPAEVEREISRLVRKHLAWARGRGSGNLPVRSGNTCLSAGDYATILSAVSGFRGDLARLSRKKLLLGLADLVAYVKSVSGPSRNPTVPIPVTAMLKFVGWDRNKSNPGYYVGWLTELERLDILKVADSDYSPGAGKGKCRTYSLFLDLSDRDLVDDHEAGFSRAEQAFTSHPHSLLRD
jgi:hypothetical protein